MVKTTKLQPPGTPVREFPAIYASPTVETLDGSLVSGRREYARQVHRSTSKSKSQEPSAVTSNSWPMDEEPPKSVALQYTPKRIPTGSSLTPVNTSRVHDNVATRSAARERRRRKKRVESNSSIPHDFQHTKDALHVGVRTIDVASRTVFEPIPPVSVQEWLKAAESAEMERKVSMRKRLSPSMQHLQLLHRFQAFKTVQQLNFSPSVGLNADIFCPWWEGKSKRRDGRYRSIDPLQATRTVLPSTPPILSNRKVRLPMRADVGFSNPPQEEIQLKQEEIRLETQWEEASPRLIILITSDTLGQAVGNDAIPWAGKELLIAKERNAQHFGGDFVDIKGNQNSVLSPPLGASYSSTLGWRPRAFYDRPSGLEYGIACPLGVNLDMGNDEPFLCSLTLYSLPVGRSPHAGEVYGKMSEEFYFPAGNWNGKVNFDALRNDKGEVDQAMVDAWIARKHKALYSYDDLFVSGGDKSLHLVLQVYRIANETKVAQGIFQKKVALPKAEDLAQPIPLAKKKSFTQRIKKTLSKRGNKSDGVERRDAKGIDFLDGVPSNRSDEGETVVATQSSDSSAQQIYDKFGTQFVSPLCFGVMSFCPNHMYSARSARGADNSKMAWPNGAKQLMQLYASSSLNDHEDFVNRLAEVAGEERSKIPGDITVCELDVESNPSGDTNNSNDEEGSFDEDSGGRRNFFGKNRSQPPRPIFKRGDHGTSSLSICGKASLFTSFLGSDFTQTMLKDVPSFGFDEAQKPSVLPRLLVDVTGDCAIAVNNLDGNTTPSDGRKRSDLIRLPVANDPSGYVDLSEIREIQYLPPRFEKQFDYDIPTSFGSVRNLLYIYPRFLKSPSLSLGHEQGRRRRRSDAKIKYCLRLRLVRNREDDSMEVIPSFYNPAPWAGPTIRNDFYTKVTAHADRRSTGHKEGVMFRDEIKMRLPLIIDGTFNLHFVLLEIDITGGELVATEVAETYIPLSSSSAREASSGVRVTTVIPNGSHRLKLGDTQLQFETRLVSTVHVADPTSATLLRDFPFVADPSEIEEGLSEIGRSLSLAPSKSVVGKSLSADPIVELEIPFYQLFGNASDSTLLSFFPLYMYMHLCNMVNQNREGIQVSTFMSDSTNSKETKFLMDNLQSLFELLRKVKLKLLARSNAMTARQRVEVFVKETVDFFDESLLVFEAPEAKATNGTVAFEENREESKQGPTRLKLDRSRSESTHDHSRQEVEEDHDDDATDGGAIHFRVKDTVRAEIDLRLARTASKVNAVPAPFARVAYGASKTDRWRAEAEHYQQGARYSHLVDDDMTIGTILPSVKDVDELPGLPQSSTWVMAEDDDSVVDSSGLKPGTRTFVGTGTDIAKRVRSAAQTMIAPCITAIPLGNKNNGKSPSDMTYVDRNGFCDEPTFSSVEATTKNSQHISNNFVRHGSDAEDELLDEDAELQKVDPDSTLFRFEGGSVLLAYSYGQSNETESTTRVFAYEPIIGLWMKAWVEHTARNLSNTKNESRFPILSLWNQGEYSPIYGFYANMDVLLPICLKSLAARCASLLPKIPSNSRVLMDTSHMEIIFPLAGVLGSSLIGEAISGDDKEESLTMALSSADTVLDFLIGLATVIHPQQFSEVLYKFFKVMREAETEGSSEKGDFKWNENTIHLVRCSRQLRLRSIERFATVGCFLAMNFPLKFNESRPRRKDDPPIWTKQARSPFVNSGTESELKPPGQHRLPTSGWLAELLTHESLLICSLSCEVFVSEAIAHIEITDHVSTNSKASSVLNDRPGKSLTKQDLLLFQAIGLHAITCVHELIIRRHAMDNRFQTEQCRSRIASLVARSVLEQSTSSVRWLARMESTHRIRSLWLVCFSYALQEAPEVVLRSTFRSHCHPLKEFPIHRTIRLLRLCSSTFQCLVDNACGDLSLGSKLQPWVLQESFNSICASIILLIDECSSAMKQYPLEEKKMAQGTIDLLMHILTVPQSPVTYLRTVGGALQALDKFGIEIFLESSGDNFQHWIRVIVTLMNSVSLSVRSIAVDFMISLLGEAFSGRGSIEDVALVIATVLPEVVAREIALYSVAGLMKRFDQVEQAVWPLRRALAEVEDANPLDDDRVDPQLSPILVEFCRSCQAIIDGVLIELMLQSPGLKIVGSFIEIDSKQCNVFDADEESLYEAANFFTAETAPIQRLRWLNTLKLLHESKGQWVEAAETLMLCARTIADSIPHLRKVWMPSDFVLWNDNRRSLWLGTIGQEQGFPGVGNVQVMKFSTEFLHPTTLFGESTGAGGSGKLMQPTVHSMCNRLTKVCKESISLYLNEVGTEELAFTRLEALLRVVSMVVEDKSHVSSPYPTRQPVGTRRIVAAERASLRKASASLNSDLTKLAEKLLLVADSNPIRQLERQATADALRHQYYVRVTLSGVKPRQFVESTSIPTFFEWENPCVCRVPHSIVVHAIASAGSASDNSSILADKLCTEFGKPLMNALSFDEDASIMLRVGSRSELSPDNTDEAVTYLDVAMVHADIATVDAPLQGTNSLECKRFLYRKSMALEIDAGLRGGHETLFGGLKSSLVELTVARPFPCALSRQRTILTSEFVEGSA